MNAKEIMEIFADTAYVRLGGRPEERKTADYLCSKVEGLGLQARIEEFEVPLGDLEEAVFQVDGVTIPCKGYMCAGSGAVEAPLYYLRHTDKYSLSQCRGKIVLIDGYLGYWVYQDLLENGAVGIVTHDGNVNYADRDIDARELRSYVHNGKKLLAVNINTKDAVALVNQGAVMGKITLKQHEYTSTSQNVVLELPGQVAEYIVLTAHYDSTSLSQGAYDNMSGAIGLLGIAEYFAAHPHRYGLRFVWCGSEERGLLGSKAYCAAHEAELEQAVLNINLDMIGCIMGMFIGCATAEEKLVHYLDYLAQERGFAMKAYQDVYSSDSTPFADKGVPALSFARRAPSNTATIHNSYDTMALMKGEQMVEDIDFIICFTQRMANAARCPVAREMPENMKEKLDTYLNRKRPKP